MKWVKRGLVFAPGADVPWAMRAAMTPCVAPAGDHARRVYFAGRDDRGRGQIGVFDMDVKRLEVFNLRPEPVLGLGQIGTFDDNGVNAPWVVESNGKVLMYYTGWTLGVTVPFYLHVGLAARDETTQRFARVSIAPILDRTSIDPFLTAAPCVRLDEGKWRMWYVSGAEWRERGGAVQHRYHIRYAQSRDGLTWERKGIVCIDFKSDDEYAIARPCVVRDVDRYRMWYCYRGDAYRIGYAESADGIEWVRRDDLAGITASEHGWDSQMVAYPCVFDCDGARYMLYNGDGYGRTGIGLAVQEP